VAVLGGAIDARDDAGSAPEDGAPLLEAEIASAPPVFSPCDLPCAVSRAPLLSKRLGLNPGLCLFRLALSRCYPGLTPSPTTVNRQIESDLGCR
jgi:hypothetical protein